MRTHKIASTTADSATCTCGETFRNTSLLFEHAARSEQDARPDRDRPPKPCLKRVVEADGAYGFCLMPDGHGESCGDARCSPAPPPNTFGPKR